MNSYGWTAAHTKTTIFFTILLLASIVVIFNIRIIHIIWFPITLLIVFWYFYRLHYCVQNWLLGPDEKFEKVLFEYSLKYRVITSLLLVFVAEITWGIPDYVGAVDAKTYHHEAIIIADYLRSFDISGAYLKAISFTGSIDNAGPPLLLGFIFAVFGKYYLIGSFFYALIGSISVIYLYRISNIIWGSEIGRYAGILFMHFPLALFYSVVFLKEGIVVFLLLAVVYYTTKAINERRLSFSEYFFLIAAMVMLFFFRTAVGALLALLVPAAFLVNRFKGSIVKSLLIITTTTILFGFIMYIIGEYEFFLDRIYSAEVVGEQRTTGLGLETVDILDISLLDIALAPVYIIMAIIAPFAGFIDVGTRHGTPHDANYYRIAGIVIWNYLSFFSIIGFYYSLKEKFLKGFMIWAFTAGYTYILVVTVLFTRDRFAYIGMPLMLAMAAVGIFKLNKHISWLVYLFAIAVMTIIWNSLMINVRGL